MKKKKDCRNGASSCYQDHVNCFALNALLVKSDKVSSEESVKTETLIMVQQHCVLCLGELSPDDANVYASGHSMHKKCAENENTKCCSCGSPLIEVC